MSDKPAAPAPEQTEPTVPSAVVVEKRFYGGQNASLEKTITEGREALEKVFAEIEAAGGIEQFTVPDALAMAVAEMKAAGGFARFRAPDAPENLTFEEAVRVRRVQALAEDTFGEVGKANAWLQGPLAELNGKAPLTTAQTEAGARAVEIILGKIAWGAAS